MKRVAIVAALSLLPASVAGQSTNQLQMNAVVVNGTMLVVPLSDLAFGTVLPGTPVVVPPTSPFAGEFRVQGPRNAEVAVTMTLPAVLAHTALAGVSMPVTFGATDGIWRRGDADIALGVPFDPSAPPQMRFGPTPRPLFHLWIGGTASPGVAQAAGIYRGTIVLDVALIL